jgi:hypothetical protein
MPAAWALSPLYFVSFGFVCGAVGFRVGWRMGSRLALPLAQALLGWMVFVLAWTFLGAAWAAASVGAWALGTTVVSIYVFFRHPVETDARVIRAASYRASMLAWIQAAGAPENGAAATVGQHLREAIWYTAAAMATANFASMAMGAVLLNYMNAYVATLLRAATNTTTVLLLGWNVWSVVRVAAYIAIGAAAAAPLLRFSGWHGDARAVPALALAGAAGVAIDLVLKLALSSRCGRALAGAIELDAAKANGSSEAPTTLHLD